MDTVYWPKDRRGAIPQGSQLEQLAANSTLSADQIQALTGQTAGQVVDAIPQGEAFDWLVAMTGQTADTLTNVLRETHHITTVWYIMGAVGVISALGIYAYGRWVVTLGKQE